MTESHDNDLHGLVPANQVDPLGGYMRGLWHRRDYIVQVPLNELRVEQANTLLGNAWLIINPVLSVSVYYLVFGIILDVSRGVDDYIAFLTIGVFTFLYSNRMITNGAKSVSASIGLVRAIRFPRAVLPLSTAVASAIRFAPNFLVMLATVLAFGNFPDLRWLALAPIFLLQSLFSLGGSFFVARLNHLYADMENTLPFLFRLLFYMSGVLYSVDRFVDHGGWRSAFALNPLYDYLTLWRWALLGTPIAGWAIIGALVWAIVTPVAGFIFFRSGEAGYGRAS
ncbi:MAG: teichoic acid transport system permease protein [Acidimicrobiales bacterium]|jgi:teichoic acid transport system permease protein